MAIVCTREMTVCETFGNMAIVISLSESTMVVFDWQAGGWRSVALSECRESHKEDRVLSLTRVLLFYTLVIWSVWGGLGYPWVTVEKIGKFGGLWKSSSNLSFFPLHWVKNIHCRRRQSIKVELVLHGHLVVFSSLSSSPESATRWREKSERWRIRGGDLCRPV